MLRSGAQAGDVLAVTGSPGRAAAGLALLVSDLPDWRAEHYRRAGANIVAEPAASECRNGRVARSEVVPTASVAGLW